jgi:hypothetical protein
MTYDLGRFAEAASKGAPPFADEVLDRLAQLLPPPAPPARPSAPARARRRAKAA